MAEELAGFSASLSLDGDIGKDADKQLDQVEKRFSSAFGKVGAIIKTAAVGAATSIVGIGGAAIKVADTVDQESKRLAVALGRPAEEAEKYRRLLREVYRDTAVQSFAEAGQAIQDVESRLQKFGVTGEKEIARVTKGVVALNRTFKSDFGNTTEAVAALMRNFGLDSTQALDFVTAGFQKGLNASGDFLASVATYAVQFKEAGADAGAFFNALESGLGQGKAGTKAIGLLFREFTLNAKTGAAGVTGAIQALSDATGTDLTGAFERFARGQITAIELMRILQGEVRNVQDPILRNQIGLALFGQAWATMGEQAVLALDLTSQKLTEFEGKTEGLELQFQTFGEALDFVKKNGVLALESIGAAMLPIIQERIPQIQAAAQKLADLGPGIGEVFAAGLDFALKVLVPFLETLTSIVAASPGGVQSIVAIGAALLTWTALGGPVIQLFKVLSTGFGLFKGGATLARGLTTSLTGVGGGGTAAAGGLTRVVTAGAPFLSFLSRGTGLVLGLIGRAGVAGIAGLTSYFTLLVNAMVPLGAAATASFGALATGSAAVLLLIAVLAASGFAVYKAGESLFRYGQEVNANRERIAALKASFGELIASYEAQGIAIDRNKIKGLEYNAAVQELSRQVTAYKDANLSAARAQTYADIEAAKLRTTTRGLSADTAALASSTTQLTGTQTQASLTSAEFAAAGRDVVDITKLSTKEQQDAAYAYKLVSGQINPLALLQKRYTLELKGSNDEAAAAAIKTAQLGTASETTEDSQRNLERATGDVTEGHENLEQGLREVIDSMRTGGGVADSLAGRYDNAAGAANRLADAQFRVINSTPQGGGFAAGGIVPFAKGGVVPHLDSVSLKAANIPAQALARGGRKKRRPTFGLVGEEGPELRSDLGGSHITPARATDEIFDAVAQRLLAGIGGFREPQRLPAGLTKKTNVRIDAPVTVTLPIAVVRGEETTQQFLRKHGPGIATFVKEDLRDELVGMFSAAGLVES